MAAVVIANWDTLKNYHWQLQPIWLLYALLFMMVDLFLGAWGWHLLTARLANYDNHRKNIKIWWYANLGRRMPGTVWYIAGRAALYEQVGVRKLTVAVLSGLELALILLSGIVVTLFSLPFWGSAINITGEFSRLWILPILVPVCVLIIRPRSLEKIWGKLSGQKAAVQLGWRDTLTWFTYYCLVWIVGALVLFSIINSFQPLPLDRIIDVMGIWALVGTISLAGTLALAGLGLREISLSLLLTLMMPFPVALIISIVTRLFWLGGELISAFFSLKL